MTDSESCLAEKTLTITFSEPASAELLRRIRELPSILDVSPSGKGSEGLPPTVRQLTAFLEDSADVEETIYLLESLPGIQSVSD